MPVKVPADIPVIVAESVPDAKPIEKTIDVCSSTASASEAVAHGTQALLYSRKPQRPEEYFNLHCAPLKPGATPLHRIGKISAQREKKRSRNL